MLAASASAAPPQQSPYIVVLRTGADPGAFAAALGVSAEHTYTAALDGFSGSLSPAQLTRAAADPIVLGVFPDGTGFAFSDQAVPTGVSRVGALDSPTAAIDGVDERVGVDIAIIDSGVDPDQPDLVVGPGVDCGGSGSTDDVVGHGTAVAGVAAAIDDTSGVVGVAPGARIRPVKIADAKGRIRDSAVLCGLEWVTANAPENDGTVKVANMSFDDNGRDDGNCGYDSHDKLRDPIHAAVCAAAEAGVTLVASAGNRHRDASKYIPAAYDEVITVSGLADSDGAPGGLGPADCRGDADDTFAPFSNFGADVDVAAPGTCIQTTASGGGTTVVSGTSFSAPHVAGAAALWLAGHPTDGPGDVKLAILSAREDVHLDGDPDGIDEGVLNVSSF